MQNPPPLLPLSLLLRPPLPLSLLPGYSPTGETAYKVNLPPTCLPALYVGYLLASTHFPTLGVQDTQPWVAQFKKEKKREHLGDKMELEESESEK